MTMNSHGIKTKMVMVKGATGSPGADGGTADTNSFRNSGYDIYVDGQNGDNNAAGTSSAPLKTLMAALKWLNTKGPDAIIHLQTAGTYEINYGRLINTSVRIVGATSGVIVSLTKALSVYNSWFRTENVTMTGSNLTPHNSFIDIRNSVLQNVMIAYGGEVEITNSTFHQVTAYDGAAVVTNNATVSGQSKNAPALYSRNGSMISTLGTLTLSPLSEATTQTAVASWRGNIMWDADLVDNTVSGAQYGKGITVSAGMLLGAASKIAALEALGYNYSDSSALVVKGKQLLETNS